MSILQFSQFYGYWTNIYNYLIISAKISLLFSLSLVLFIGLQGCTTISEEKNNQVSNLSNSIPSYDMRQDLAPSRLTIAMWDYSWIYMHYEGGAFEDWGKAIDGAKERGFNTIRIDAMPLIISKMKTEDEEVTIEGDSLKNWGPSDKNRKHAIIESLIDFVSIATERDMYIILSTWNESCLEYPDLRLEYANDREKYWQTWEKTLDILDEKGLLKNVVYVDLDQEFPYFSPVKSTIAELGKQKVAVGNDMEQAGNTQGLKWNQQQMKFVKEYLHSSLVHFQAKYPELRFTFSITSFWEEIRSMNIKNFDVLELHFWLTQMPRFNERSGFNRLPVKDRGNHDYTEYNANLKATMQSVRPMLLKEMHNRLKFASEWSEEAAAPLTTSEAWGPWWHGDHDELEWQWLYDWCEEGVDLSAQYGLWGSTPWNYSHPYWNNWENIEWYQRVNNNFLTN